LYSETKRDKLRIDQNGGRRVRFWWIHSVA
jgi:hypothetical protein